MKNFILFLIAVTLFSCNNETKPVDYAIVAGKITNSQAEKLSISSREQKINKSTVIEKDGSFIDTLKNVGEGIYMFYDGKNYNRFYLQPGDNLKITYDANDFKNSLKYTGKGSEISNYQLAKNDKIREFTGKGPDTYLLNEAAYKEKAIKLKTNLLALLSSAKGIPDSFKTLEEKEINYQYLNDIAKYESYHSYYAKKPDFKASEGFTDELKSLDYNNETDYKNSESYKNLVMMHYSNLASELGEKESIDRGIAFIKVTGDIKNETIKNDLLSKTAGEMNYSDNMEEFYNQFMKASTDEEQKKKLTETYNILKTVSPGNQSPKFVNYENYKGGKTSLDDLKGKYVYIDVWATWCGPCKYEVPYLIELDKKYKGRNITFLSISIDKAKDHDKWKKMIEEKGMGGVQLFADNDWKSKFVRDYLINGIPHFILIDPEGKIVKYSAPRPSDKKLIDLLDKLKI